MRAANDHEPASKMSSFENVLTRIIDLDPNLKSKFLNALTLRLNMPRIRVGFEQYIEYVLI